MKPGWIRENCSSCDGHGMVSQYTHSGDDFLGAEECRDCGGKGYIFLHEKSGILAEYPGGSLVGRLSKAEMAQRQLKMKGIESDPRN